MTDFHSWYQFGFFPGHGVIWASDPAGYFLYDDMIVKATRPLPGLKVSGIGVLDYSRSILGRWGYSGPAEAESSGRYYCLPYLYRPNVTPGHRQYVLTQGGWVTPYRNLNWDGFTREGHRWWRTNGSASGPYIDPYGFGKTYAFEEEQYFLDGESGETKTATPYLPRLELTQSGSDGSVAGVYATPADDWNGPTSIVVGVPSYSQGSRVYTMDADFTKCGPARRQGAVWAIGDYVCSDDLAAVDPPQTVTFRSGNAQDVIVWHFNGLVLGKGRRDVFVADAARVFP